MKANRQVGRLILSFSFLVTVATSRLLAQEQPNITTIDATRCNTVGAPAASRPIGPVNGTRRGERCCSVATSPALTGRSGCLGVAFPQDADVSGSHVSVFKGRARILLHVCGSMIHPLLVMLAPIAQ